MKRNLLFNQLTAIGKRFAMVLTMLVVVGVGNVWGETATLTITQINLGLGDSYTSTSKEIDDITINWTSLMKENNKNTNNIQAKANEGEIWNSTALPGNIVSVEVKHSGTARSSTIYFGASAKATTESSPFSGTETILPTGDYKYFYIQRGSNAAYWEEIIITYETSSSGDCNVWKLITDASDLKAGDQIVIAAKDVDKAIGKNSDNGNNRTAVDITKNNNTITFGNQVKTITLGAGKKENTFAFEVEGDYLYAASSNSNYLKTKSTLDDNGSWTIAIASNGVATIKAQGTNTRNTMQYNNGSTLFACYASASQSSVCIYKYVKCTAEPTHYLLRK